MNQYDLTIKEGAAKAGKISLLVLAGIGVLALISSAKKLRDMYKGKPVNEVAADDDDTEEN